MCTGLNGRQFPGKRGILFQSSNEYLEADNTSVLLLNHDDPFTVGFWYRSIKPRDMCFFSKHHDYVDEGYFLNVLGDDEGGVLQFVMREDDTGGILEVRSNEPILLNDQWHHIALTKAGATGSGIDFYLDGKKVESSEALKTQLEARKQKNPDIGVAIGADKKAYHEEVVRVIDIVRKVKIHRFAINVEQLERS